MLKIIELINIYLNDNGDRIAFNLQSPNVMDEIVP